MEFNKLIIFQAHSLNGNNKCIVISKTNTLSELYNKITEIGYLFADASKNSVKKSTQKVNIYAIMQNEDKLICIPNKGDVTIGDFIKQNNKYFQDCTHMRTIHPLYKIYIIEGSIREQWRKANGVKTSTEIMYDGFQRLLKCFS
jgi:hypothetical protein